jgi:hypothetical protein
MNPDKTIQSTLWLMVIVQTIGSVDLPGFGNRKLPAPKQYVAIVVLWSIFGFVADISASAGRVVAQLSVLTLLTGMIIGPFGKRFTNLLSGVSALFPAATPPNTPAPGTTSII